MMLTEEFAILSKMGIIKNDYTHRWAIAHQMSLGSF